MITLEMSSPILAVERRVHEFVHEQRGKGAFDLSAVVRAVMTDPKIVEMRDGLLAGDKWYEQYLWRIAERDIKRHAGLSIRSVGNKEGEALVMAAPNTPGSAIYVYYFREDLPLSIIPILVAKHRGRARKEDKKADALEKLHRIAADLGGSIAGRAWASLTHDERKLFPASRISAYEKDQGDEEEAA